MTSLLLSPIKLRELTIRNRIMISPMGQYSAIDGLANDWHLVHLGKYATGGAGLIVVEATAVEARGRTTPADLGLWEDSQIEGLARIVQFLHAHGSAVGIQLAHAGRKAGGQAPWDEFSATSVSGGHFWQTVAPSAIPVRDGAPPPEAMSLDDIGQVTEAWRQAARRAAAAGFDIVEVHGAHGYLLHQFASSLTNRRNDEYGGDLQGRIRLAVEVAEAVRQEWPASRPVFFRMSAVDPSDPGWQLEDAIALATALKRAGVDVIDCSSGGIGRRAVTSAGPRPQGYLAHVAKRVRAEAGIATVAVGLITEPSFAEELLRNEASDLIAIGREALLNPHWALHAGLVLAPERGFSDWPVQYGWWLDKRAEAQRADAA